MEKELLEAVIHSSQEAISVVDHEGKVILVNPAYTRMVGMSRDEVIGKPPTVDIREGESMHLHVLKSMKPIRGVPLLVGPLGKEVIVNAAPIVVDGQLKGSVAVAHDITELKYLTEELARVKSLVRRMQSRYTFEDIVAKGANMAIAVDQARRAAAVPVTVLLQGESGTGKEMFAHAIHHASQRGTGPFVKVNCAAIPETLLESELFGYEEGAFTGARKGGKRGLFQEADGGTIFLDEIGEISPGLQAKLLRVLQEKEFIRIGAVKPNRTDVRVIAATHQNLQAAIRSGAFREDLYYRINAFPIFIPPLRQRIGELPFLVPVLLKKLNQEYGRSVKRLSDEAMVLLTGYSWPGNVRELENVLGRAMINMRIGEDTVLASHLPVLTNTECRSGIRVDLRQQSVPAPNRTLAEIIDDVERQVIEAALSATGGNKVETAKRLGIAVRSLYYKLERYGMK